MKIFILKHFKHELMKYRWGRKWIGGKFYKIRTALPMADIWTDEIFYSCQAFVVKTEEYSAK